MVPTVEEILAANESNVFNDVHDVIYIDPVTRQLSVPSSEIILGVEEDNNAECKFFSIPKVVGNNIDVTKCSLRVKYKNAEGSSGYYPVKHAAANDSSVVFCWELSKKVTKVRGDTEFSIWVCRSVDGSSLNDWHTTPAYGRVLPGIPISTPDEDSEAAEDFVGQQQQLAEQIEALSALVPMEVKAGQPTLSPGVYYQFGEVSELSVALSPGTPGKAEEYVFEFTPTSGFTGLSITPEVSWIGSRDFQQGKRCVVSVCLGMAVMGCA